MNLKELYLRQRDINELDIPVKWEESFNKFMFGKTCGVEHKDDGSIQFVYWWSDFSHWYEENKVQIERDLKLDDLV
jgi:hypothetical protein